MEHDYETATTHEQFLSYETADGQLAGFLRLSLPRPEADALPGSAEVWQALPEIAGAAMIRELHVYGPALSIGSTNAGEAQHLGLGRRLISLAQRTGACGRVRASGRDLGHRDAALLRGAGFRKRRSVYDHQPVVERPLL